MPATGIDERRRDVEEDEAGIDLSEVFLQDGLQPEPFEGGDGVHVLDEGAVFLEQRQDGFLEQFTELHRRAGKGGDDAVHAPGPYLELGRKNVRSIEHVVVDDEDIPALDGFSQKAAEGAVFSKQIRVLFRFFLLRISRVTEPLAAPYSTMSSADSKGTDFKRPLTQTAESGPDRSDLAEVPDVLAPEVEINVLCYFVFHLKMPFSKAPPRQ